MELLSIIRHQMVPSIGPGRTAGLTAGGISASINARRDDDSVAKDDKRANVGES